MIMIMIGTTTKATVHGNPGERRVLPAGLRVRLELADNLPADSPIKYWASPALGDPWPADIARWADEVGVGLHADDVTINTETKR